MPRQKGDGRGRLGGRQPGTPNRDKPIKAIMRETSLDYFTPSVPEVGADGKPTGRLVSRFEEDLAQLDPLERVRAHLQLARFHTPQMQASSVDVALASADATLAARLASLAGADKPGGEKP